jgi:hypothetical protein
LGEVPRVEFNKITEAVYGLLVTTALWLYHGPIWLKTGPSQQISFKGLNALVGKYVKNKFKNHNQAT